MIGFAALVDALAFAHGDASKARVLADYLTATPDPARGHALAVLARAARFPPVKPTVVRGLASARLDPVLFDLSRDFVGDALETIALMWPSAPSNAAAPALAAVTDALAETPKADLPALIAGWLDGADAATRVVLLKLVTGARDVGLATSVLIAALQALGQDRIAGPEIAAAWHSQAPPYDELLAWIDRRGPRPASRGALYFRPIDRPQTIAGIAELPLQSQELAAEWRWDGVRVQLAADPGGARLFSAHGTDISAAFPDIIQAMRFHAVLDGVLLTGDEAEAGPLAPPHPRLGRKTASPRQIAAHGLTVRLFDLRAEAGEDVSACAFDVRRDRLQAWFGRVRPIGMALSPLLPRTAWDPTSALPNGANGWVFKQRRGTASWQVMRHAPSRTGVLMYAERGGDRAGGAFAAYTVGLWRDDRTLVPVGRANATLLDTTDRATLDGWIATHTTERFGPVRAVAIGMVVEIRFDAVRRSPRHKSGVVLENLSIAAVRAELDVTAADLLSSL